MRIEGKAFSQFSSEEKDVLEELIKSFQNEDYKKAASFANKTLQMNENNCIALYYKGLLFAKNSTEEKNYLDEAFSCWERSFKNVPLESREISEMWTNIIKAIQVVTLAIFSFHIQQIQDPVSFVNNMRALLDEKEQQWSKIVRLISSYDERISTDERNQKGLLSYLSQISFQIVADTTDVKRKFDEIHESCSEQINRNSNQKMPAACEKTLLSHALAWHLFTIVLKEDRIECLKHAIVKYERTISVLEDSGFEEYIILINNTITKIQEEIKRCEEQTQKEEQERKEALKRKKEKEERERRRVEALRVERDNLTKEKDRLSTELKDYEKRINEGRLKEKEKLEKIQEDIRLLNLDSEEAELRISNKTQSEMELNELESQIDELKQKLSSLGLFAGKQKKQINAMQERINILPSRIEMEKESNKKEADNIRKCNTERINRLTTETLQIQQETEDCENILNEKKQKTNEQYNKVVKRIEEINQELSVVNI